MTSDENSDLKEERKGDTNDKYMSKIKYCLTLSFSKR